MCNPAYRQAGYVHMCLYGEKIPHRHIRKYRNHIERKNIKWIFNINHCFRDLQCQ